MILVKSVAGSRLYGTAREDSDFDYRGVILEPVEALLGLSSFEQLETKNPDVVLYGLRKFARLALQNNPNILDTLFTPQHYWIEYDPLWLHIHEIKEDFLSQRIRNTYVGYAHSQLKRIETHRRFASYGELVSKPECMEKQEWENYKQYLRERNPKRLETELRCGYDTKHGAHLARLILQGKDILRNATFNPVLEGERLAFVLYVLTGSVSYTELLEWSTTQINYIKSMYSALPEEPNTELVEKTMIDIYKVSLS